MSDPGSHPHPFMLSLILTSILNLCLCCSLRLECPSPSLTKCESMKEEKWISSSRPRISSPLQWRVCSLPLGRVICFLFCLCRGPTSQCCDAVSTDKLTPQALPSLVFSSSWTMPLLTHWYKNPEDEFPSITKSCNVFFQNSSLAFHFCPGLVPLPPFKLSVYLLLFLS